MRCIFRFEAARKTRDISVENVTREIMSVDAMRITASALAVLLLTGIAGAEAPLGKQPGYTSRALSPLPNGQAVTKSIWAPGLDEGYVPQGVTFLNGRLFISGYLSTDPAQDRGPCRLFTLDPASGRVLSFLDLPAQCGHAGGLAKGPRGNIFVADSRHLFEIELSERSPGEPGQVVRTVALSGQLKGSFAASTADGIWLGAYERNGEPKLFRIPWAALRQPKISEAQAVEAIALPLLAQGAAFDGSGALWITRSSSKLGELLKIDRKSGAILLRFPMPIGIEDIGFEPDGALWSLSEAGSKRWNAWSAFYPLAFRLDVNLLKQ